MDSRWQAPPSALCRSVRRPRPTRDRTRGAPMTEIDFGKYSVEITNEDKVLFPESGITKGEIAEYYRNMGDVMIPHMKHRPVTLHRFPNGIGKPGFIQKSISDYFPEWIPRETVEKEEGEITMVMVEK